MHLLGYLGFLAEVGRQFEAGDAALVVGHDDDGVDGVELDVRQHGLLPGHHHLLADGLVLVDAEVEHVHLQAGEGGVSFNGGFRLSCQEPAATASFYFVPCETAGSERKTCFIFPLRTLGKCLSFYIHYTQIFNFY